MSSRLHRRRAVEMGLCLSLAALSACDNAPNPNFQKELQAQQAASAGDTYLQLGSAPRVVFYGGWKEGQRQSNANIEAQKFANAYASMLELLDKEPIARDTTEHFFTCRGAFAKALDFQKDESPKSPAAVSTAGATIYAELNRCRDAAQKREESGEAKSSNRILRRFSSAGMILVSVSMVAQGEESEGVRSWIEAEKALNEDKAGFQFSLKSFRGY